MADYACTRCHSLNVDISRSARRGDEWISDCQSCGHSEPARFARATAQACGLRVQGLPPRQRFLPVSHELGYQPPLPEVAELPDQQQVDRVVSIVSRFSAGLAVGTRGGR